MVLSSRVRFMDRYQFEAPLSVKEAKQRLRLLLRGIRDIDRQLGDKTMKRSEVWRSRAISSKVYKQAEYDFVKDELSELRKLHASHEADVYAPEDPRHLLLRLREEVRLSQRNEPNRLPKVLEVVDHYFEHEGGLPHEREKATRLQSGPDHKKCPS